MDNQNWLTEDRNESGPHDAEPAAPARERQCACGHFAGDHLNGSGQCQALACLPNDCAGFAAAREDAQTVTDMLRQELENIANAMRSNFEDAEDFRAWAQNRARWILSRAAEAQPPAPREVNAELLEALQTVMATPVPHAVGCSHVAETCSCHRKRALDAIARAKAAPAETISRADVAAAFAEIRRGLFTGSSIGRHGEVRLDAKHVYTKLKDAAAALGIEQEKEGK